jgi:uncharacterized protein (TIGR02145 family)
MKKKNRNFINPFFVTLVLLTITLNCKKEEKILRKDPLITWSNPADINDGTRLGPKQLNAISDVSGTFIYTPPIGTKLNEGLNQDLKVYFKPNDSTNYNPATKTVQINVGKAITVTDINGNIYHTLTIGNQVWMLENLKTTKYNDNTDISNVTDNAAWSALTTPGYCWYNNEAANKDSYGALYNWYAINSGKLCPAGWHVPTKEDFMTLEVYLISNGYNYNSSASDNKYALAIASSTGWLSNPEVGAVGNTDFSAKRNASGFTALPGGYRPPSYFMQIREVGYFWSSTPNDNSTAWAIFLHYYQSSVVSYFSGKNYGFSVRCIKD